MNTLMIMGGIIGGPITLSGDIMGRTIMLPARTMDMPTDMSTMPASMTEPGRNGRLRIGAGNMSVPLGSKRAARRVYSRHSVATLADLTDRVTGPVATASNRSTLASDQLCGL